MFTWVVASKGTHRLAVAYLLIAAVALILAAGTWAVGATHHASGQATLELNITRYSG